MLVEMIKGIQNRSFASTPLILEKIPMIKILQLHFLNDLNTYKSNDPPVKYSIIA